MSSIDPNLLSEESINRDCGETIKDLLRETFHFIRPSLEELYWVDFNVLYLNKVCGVPQIKVADIMGMSQLGVSKRVRTSVVKVRNLIKRPESDILRVRKDFQMLLAPSLVETLVLYYQVKTFSVVSRILGGVKEGAVRVRVTQALSQLRDLVSQESRPKFLQTLRSIRPQRYDALEEQWKLDPQETYDLLSTLARRYLDYLELVFKTGYYSDYVFKIFDKERVSSSEVSSETDGIQ